MAGTYAFVTLVSSDAYLPGALAQVAALRDVHPTTPSPPEVPFQTVCLVTPETLDVTTIKFLRRAFDLVVGVEVLEQENNSNLKLLGEYRPFLRPYPTPQDSCRVLLQWELLSLPMVNVATFRQFFETSIPTVAEVSIPTPLTLY